MDIIIFKTNKELFIMKEKIAFVITKAEVGGAQTWVNQLKKILEDQFIIYLIVSDHGWLQEQFDSDKVKIIPQMGIILSISSSIKIAKFLKKESIKVVISNSANAGIHSRLSKIFYNHKNIYVSHGWPCIYNGGRFKRIYCFIEKMLSIITDSVLCVSNNDKKNALDIIKINPNKIVTIRNSVIPLKSKENINLRKKFIFVGRLTHPKRPDLFLEAAKKNPSSDFYIIGDGPHKNTLQQSYSYLKNVFFLGEIKNFTDYLSYDVFILSSDSEGLPMSALEAASAGLPMILSDVGGCHELINSEKGNLNGFIFNNSIDDLDEKIKLIICNYQYYYSNAQNIKKFFDIRNSREKYVTLIKE
ncbi:glycosyltransferase [Providencia stuartii]|nr:glycosyltransferase [Providencia stuartii]